MIALYGQGIAAAAGLAASIQSLEDVGWDVEDRLRYVTIRSPANVSVPTILDGLTPLLGAAIEVSITSSTGFSLGATATSFVLHEAPSHLGDHYAGARLEAARHLAGGDVSAARAVGGNWKAEAKIDLARPLSVEEPALAWRAVRSADVVVTAVNELPWWRLRDLFAFATPLICVGLTDVALRYVTPGLAIVSPEFVQDALDVAPVEDKRKAVLSASGVTLPAGVPLPDELEPVGEVVGAEALITSVRSHQAASAWAWLASEVTVNDSGHLSFFGLRRVTCQIDKSGLSNASVRDGALALYRWSRPKSHQIGSLPSGTLSRSTTRMSSSALRRTFVVRRSPFIERFGRRPWQRSSPHSAMHVGSPRTPPGKRPVQGSLPPDPSGSAPSLLSLPWVGWSSLTRRPHVSPSHFSASLGSALRRSPSAWPFGPYSSKVPRSLSRSNRSPLILKSSGI